MMFNPRGALLPFCRCDRFILRRSRICLVSSYISRYAALMASSKLTSTPPFSLIKLTAARFSPKGPFGVLCHDSRCLAAKTQKAPYRPPQMAPAPHTRSRAPAPVFSPIICDGAYRPPNFAICVQLGRLRV